jgi:secreted trypsin-like serine protease
LIHPRVFLTAGHCTDGLDAYGVTRVWVNFDPYALNRGTLLDVEQVITHPDYYWGPNSNPHDVAVLILKRPVRRIQPATLPEEGFLDHLLAEGKLRQGSEGAKFTVVGYGGLLDWPPPQVSYDDYRRFARSEYQALLKAWLRMSQNQATCDGGTCFGDSGGPAFWSEPDGSEILVGITSWGDANCVASGFNYRVDIADTLSFIADVIAGLE